VVRRKERNAEETALRHLSAMAQAGSNETVFTNRTTKWTFRQDSYGMLIRRISLARIREYTVEYPIKTQCYQRRWDVYV